MFKVIIAGSRTFTDYIFLKQKMDICLKNIKEDIGIVCGMARGSDLLGKKYAEEKGYEVLKFPAKWDLYGKKAGYLRNMEMAENADALVAFWDGKSKGTKNMIEIAKSHNLQVRIIKTDKDES